jgi:selenocysteine lyase/cysteine desulfurase
LAGEALLAPNGLVLCLHSDVSYAFIVAITLDAFRARFPILARRVYVNSCSQGALSTDVEAAFGAFTALWHEGGSPWERWVGDVERLRGLFAASIGADEDEIAVMPSASAAIAAIATALRFDGSRSRVVLGDFEFPTSAHVWLAQQARGASVAWATSDGDTLSIDAYAALVDERTLIVPATHICFRNGYRLDIPALVRLCRERGAFCLVDDFQRTGSGPIDVHELGVDFLVTGALKYQLGPSGIAYLYVRRELIAQLEPLVTGWFGRVEPFAYDPKRLDWAPTGRRFETGTPPVPNAYAAAAGIELLQSVGFETIARQIDALVERFISGARARGLDVATPQDPARRGPLVVIRVPDAAGLVERLAKRGIIASSRGNGLRVSFHAYNSPEDCDAVLAALDAEKTR